jgi:hypothetical protein
MLLNPLLTVQSAASSLVEILADCPMSFFSMHLCHSLGIKNGCEGSIAIAGIMFPARIPVTFRKQGDY